MSERQNSYRDTAPEIPSIQPSIQETKPAAGKSAARGDAKSTPVLYVESLSLENLLERAELDLEAEFWPSAASYADRALALDPSCAQAYVYKLLADLKATGFDRLKDQKRPFGSHPDYLKALEFGDADLRNRLQE